MVVSIEPPIYINEERVGVRIIDDVLITENGAEILSKTSRDLIEL
jgi:Xaa-Pro aminopeptidase